MREALGLGTRRDAPPPRQVAEAPARAAPHRVAAERPMTAAHGAGHRHRFVQDGEVPVVLVNHAQANGGQPAPRPAESRSASRAAAAELTAERTARERAERDLKQLQSVALPALEAKLFHANLARDEAVAALQAERGALAAARAEWQLEQERLEQALAEARAARERAEYRLMQVSAAAERATRTAPARAERPAPPVGEVQDAPRAKRPYTPRRRYPLADAADLNLDSLPEKPPRRRAAKADKPDAKPAPARRVKEPQPVKWWVKSRSAR